MVPIKRRLNNKPIGAKCKALKDLEKEGPFHVQYARGQNSLRCTEHEKLVIP